MKNKLKKIFNKINKEIIHLNKTIIYVNKETNKNIVYIFMDVIYSIVRYGISLDEYKYYEFYYIDNINRKTYLTKRKHNYILSKLIDKNIIDVINNKDRFYRRFNSYLNRDIKNTKQLSYKQFEDLLLDNKKILCRSVNKSFNESYKIFDLKDFRGPGFILEEINKNKLLLVEKMFNQHKLLNNINRDIVVLNIVTLNIKGNVKILSSSISFKENNKLIKGYVDIKSSNVKGHLRYEDGKIYSNNIVEYLIPCFNEACDFVKKTALELEELGEIKWSICIDSKNRIYLMDACLWNDYYFSQIPEYLKNKIGIVSKYRGI